MSVENPIKIGTNLDLGTAIDTLIRKNISMINTCFLAKVQSVNENKVSVVDLISPNDDTENPIIYNCLVAQPYSQDFKMGFIVNTDDIGVCIVCKRDITSFKDSGGEGVANTERLFNISDSIFIPLSLFNSTIDKNTIEIASDLEITSEKNIKITSGADCEIKCKNPIVIGNDSGTLASLVDSMEQLMDLIASGMTGSTTNPSAYQGGKSAIIQTMKQIVG